MQKIDAEVVHNAVAVVEHVFPGKHQRNGRRYVGEDHQRTRGFAQTELAVENIATASPSTVLPATTSAVYQTVIHSECQKPGSERIRT